MTAYNRPMDMDTISTEIEKELERRIVAGPYESLDELLTVALKALDDAQGTTNRLLEGELLKGLEGEDVALNAADWDDIEREALKVLESKKAQ